MAQGFWKRLLAFEGRVDRRTYLLTGVVLVALKYAVDFTVAARFGERWPITNYFLPPVDLTVFGFGGAHPKLYLVLWAVAIPFFWVGISLTVRRLRDAGWRAGWLILFFVPAANLLCFWHFRSRRPLSLRRAFRQRFQRVRLKGRGRPCCMA